MKKIIPFLLILSGILLILAVVGTMLYDRAMTKPGAVPLPAQVADQQLAFKSEGQPAIDEFEHMHRQEFPLVAGSVGTYGVNNEAKLWVAEAPLDFMAGRMVVDMRDKIATGNTPFTPVSERQQPERTIYELDGLGQKHYYFQSGKLIVWLAADEEIAEQALDKVLEFYP